MNKHCKFNNLVEEEDRMNKKEKSNTVENKRRDKLTN